MLSRRAGLSATAGLSCSIMQQFQQSLVLTSGLFDAIVTHTQSVSTCKSLVLSVSVYWHHLRWVYLALCLFKQPSQSSVLSHMVVFFDQCEIVGPQNETPNCLQPSIFMMHHTVTWPLVLWYCWLGLLTCKNRLPYNLYEPILCWRGRKTLLNQ